MSVIYIIYMYLGLDYSYYVISTHNMCTYLLYTVNDTKTVLTNK